MVMPSTVEAKGDVSAQLEVVRMSQSHNHFIEFL